MDFYKNCTDLYEICHIPITIVNRGGNLLLSLPNPGDEFVPHKATNTF